MKKVLFTLLLMTLTGTVEAQGYSSLNQEQLNLALVKAEKKITGGQVLTFIGIATEIVGIVVYSNGKTEYERNPPKYHILPGNKKMGTGVGIMAGGGVPLLIGIPTWLDWGNRRNQIRLEITKYNDSASVFGLGLKIRL